jgi:phosphoglycerol transferase MdoB-like AlkP superfamily enzyme
LSAESTYNKDKSPPRGGFFISGDGWIHWIKTLAFWLIIAWFSRFVFMCRSWEFYRQYDTAVLLQAYSAGWALDFSTACYLTFIQFLLCIPLSFAEVTRRWLPGWLLTQGVLFSAGYFILSLTDAELLGKWGNRINDQVFIYLEHPKEVMAFSSGAPWLPILLWLAGAMSIAVMGYRRMLRLTFKPLKPALWNHVAVRYGLLLLLLPLGMRGGLETVPLNQSAAAYANETRLNILAVNTFWNFGYYLSNGTRNIPFERFYCCSDVEAEEAVDCLYQQDSAQRFLCRTRRPNVLLIILEGFTAKASKRLSGQLNCTPQLDRIAADGLSFGQAYAAGDRTDKGLATLLSSWVPQPWHSVLHEPEKAARMPSITATLAAEGYQTLFTYGGDLRFADMKAYLMATGFRELYDQDDYPASQQNSKWGAHDEYVYLKLLEQLRGRRYPWFAGLLSLSSHEPFEVPGGSLQGTETEKFRASIQYADRCLGAFMEQARKEAWYRETLIVITADHGHDIGLNPGHSFHPDLFHIPVIITGGALTDSLRGKQIQETVSQAHLASNVLIQLGLKPLPLPYSTWFDNKSDYAYYAFNSGFGVVRDSFNLVGENQPLRRTLLKGNQKDEADSLFLKLTALQQYWIKKYRSL